MTKRKRSTSKETPPATPSEGSEGSPTVHISSDMLAGSPDIWAPGKDKPVETSDVAPDAISEDAAPAAQAQPESEESPSMNAVQPATAEDQPSEAGATETVSAPPPPAYQPRPPAYGAPGTTTRGAGASHGLGVVTVVCGLLAGLVQDVGVRSVNRSALVVAGPSDPLL